MNWKSIKVQPGAKIFLAHNFTYMIKSAIFNIEVDEYQDGSFTAHGERSTDKNFVIESVSARSLEECLNSMIDKINARMS
jgi:hypothetical protein